MKLALIGTGKIIEDALFAIGTSRNNWENSDFARPHSRDKAEKFAKQYAIKEVYTDYEELLEKTEADTVYIGLINSAHYPYAKQALLAGKKCHPWEAIYWILWRNKGFRERLQMTRNYLIFEAITVLHNESVLWDEKEPE